jgi:hypothetical protein
VGFQGANYRYADDGADVSYAPDRAAARGEGGEEEGGEEGGVFARWSQGAAPWTDVVQLGFVAFHSSVHADGARDCGLAGMLTYADVC